MWQREKEMKNVKFTEALAGYQKGVKEKKTNNIQKRNTAEYMPANHFPTGKGCRKLLHKVREVTPMGKAWQSSRQAHSSHKPEKQFQVVVRVIPPRDRSVL